MLRLIFHPSGFGRSRGKVREVFRMHTYNSGYCIWSFFHRKKLLTASQTSSHFQVKTIALEKIMIRAFNDVWNKSAEKRTSLRMGAYMVAIDRIVKAKSIRGNLYHHQAG